MFFERSGIKAMDQQAACFRRSWLAMWGKLLIIMIMAAATSTASAQVQNRPPNIIFILADDLGWNDLGPWRNTCVSTNPSGLLTPYLDSLACQGMRFIAFYSNWPDCALSRVAFMTGRFPARYRDAYLRPDKGYGVPDWLDTDVPTVPSLLKKAGYATAHFGKWYLEDYSPWLPEITAYGFDKGITTYEQEDPYWRTNSTERMVDDAIRFIEANPDKPFYINLWTYLLHSPLHPTEEQLQPYSKFAPGSNIPYKSAKQIYYASVTALDTGIGRLLKKLDEMGLTNNTIVIFTSDNGPADIRVEREAGHSGVGDIGPFRGRKKSLYNGGIRVPFIVRWPGRIPSNWNVFSSVVLSAVDLLPTLSKIAGVSLPSNLVFDGEDVSDIFSGKTRARTKPLFWEWQGYSGGHVLNRSPQLAILDGSWKLLMNPDGSRVELYDFRPWPHDEKQNQAREQPNVVEQLKQKLLTWKATLPQQNDYRWP